MNKIKVIIVGLGNIGFSYDNHLSNQYVLTHAKAFTSHPAFELIAVVDSNTMMEDQFKLYYSCPFYSDLKYALSSHHPDLIVVSVSTEKHYSVIQTIFEHAKPNILLCEKPLAYCLDEAKKIVELCTSFNCDLFVNYMRRSDPGVIQIKQRILNNEIRGPMKGVVWYSKGFFNNGSHFVNLLNFWLGKVKKINLHKNMRFWNNVDPEPDVTIEFESGVVTFLSLKEENFSHYSIEFFATNGRLRYESGGRRIEWQGVLQSNIFSDYTMLESLPKIIEDGMDYSQYNVVEQLYNYIEGKNSYLCNGKDALYTMYIMSQVKSLIETKENQATC